MIRMKVGCLLVCLLLMQYTFSKAIDLDNKRITVALSAEPPRLNSTLTSDAISGVILEHLTEGLLVYGVDGELTEGVAIHYELRDDGATFLLRENAKWSDGKKVTAHDFVFAWRQVVNPENASPYAFIMFCLENAEAINAGDKPPETLGVKAVGDYRLEVTFSRPTPFFPGLTAFTTYRPQRQDAVEKWGRAYAADAHTMLYNGAFVLSRWVHDASMRLDKNPHYWRKDEVTLSGIDIPYISADGTAMFNLFLEEKIATWIRPAIGPETIKKALKAHLTLHKFENGALFYLNFNHSPGRVTANRHLRQAIQRVLDVSVYTRKVIGNPGDVPAYSIFPDWLPGAADTLTKEYPPPRSKVDIAAAKASLALAKKALGLDAFPPLVILVGDTPGSIRQAEYLQALFEEHLGLELRVDKQLFKQLIYKSKQADFDLLMSGWAPDFNDPLTYAELLDSKSAVNAGRFSHRGYDHWLDVARLNSDPSIRAQAFGHLQQIIFDEVPLIPLFFNGDIYIQHPGLTHVPRRIFGGDPLFTYAELSDGSEPKPARVLKRD